MLRDGLCALALLGGCAASQQARNGDASGEPGRTLAQVEITGDLSAYQHPAGSSAKSPCTPSTRAISP
jgi:hypothetical protein